MTTARPARMATLTGISERTAYALLDGDNGEGFLSVEDFKPYRNIDMHVDAEATYEIDGRLVHAWSYEHEEEWETTGARVYITRIRICDSDGDDFGIKPEELFDTDTMERIIRNELMWRYR